MANRARIQYQLGIIQVQLGLTQIQMQLHRIRRRRDQRRRRRRWWTRGWLRPERRRRFGLYDQLMVELRREDEASFVNFMRMPPEMFDELLLRVGPRITKQTSSFREPLEPGLKLALTLRHLASGANYHSMRFGWRVPHNTMSKCVREVCRAIVDEYLDEAMPLPSDANQWAEVAQGFMEKWNFPHCCGTLDGKHVACKCPPGSGSTYFNYKKFYSVVFLALVDYDYKFLWVDIGGRGAESDAQVWNVSDLQEGVVSGDVELPADGPLPYDNQDVPYFFIGDDAFALRKYMMKPYGHRQLSHDERIFNYRLSRARRVVENAFGILANRFQVMLTTMQHKPGTVRLIVTACIILHNLMRIRYPRLQNNMIDGEDENHDLVPGAWRQGRNMRDVQVVKGPNRDTREGKRLRNLIKHWCNSKAGSVPWQEDKI